MAKKNARQTERRAIAEQLRKEQLRKERRRSLMILGACILVVVGLLGSAVYVYAKDRHEQNKLAGTPLEKLGVTTSAAACDPVVKKKANGNQNHVQPPQKIKYPDAPPAFGPHWYPVALIVTAIPCAWLGGKLRVMQLHTRRQ